MLEGILTFFIVILSNCFIFGISFLIFRIFKRVKDRKKVCYMSQEQKIKVISDLEKLLEHAKGIDIEKYHKDKILEEIDLRLKIIKNDIIESLGKEMFDKLKSV